MRLGGKKGSGHWLLLAAIHLGVLTDTLPYQNANNRQPKTQDARLPQKGYQPEKIGIPYEYCLFSPNDRQLLLGGPEVARIFDMGGKAPVLVSVPYSLGVGNAESGSIAVSPLHNLIAVGLPQSTIHVRGFDNKIKFHGAHRPAGGNPTLLVFSPDGKVLACAGTRGDRVLLLDPWEWKQIRLIEEKQTFSSLVYVGNHLLALGDDQGSVRLWDVNKGVHVRSVSVTRGRITALASSPGARNYLAAGSKDHHSGLPNCAVYLVDWQSGRTSHRLPAFKWLENSDRKFGGVITIAFSRDGALLACGGIGSPISLWEVATGNKVCDMEFRPEDEQALYRATCFSFSHDGRKLAAATSCGAFIWDIGGYLLAANPPPERLAPKKLEELWQALGDADPKTAWVALETLRLFPKDAVALAKARLGPLPDGKDETIATLVKELGSDDFKVREKATRELVQLGEIYLPALEKVLKQEVSTEARGRMEAILQDIKPDVSAERLRWSRAIQLLERIGAKEAYDLLGPISRNHLNNLIALEAHGAKDRLAKNNPAIVGSREHWR